MACAGPADVDRVALGLYKGRLSTSPDGLFGGLARGGMAEWLKAAVC